MTDVQRRGEIVLSEAQRKGLLALPVKGSIGIRKVGDLLHLNFGNGIQLYMDVNGYIVPQPE